MGLQIDDREFQAFVKRLSRNITKDLSRGLADAMDHIGTTAVSKFMINPGGFGKSVHSSKITSRTGRTARSLLPQGGAFSAAGAREQIRRIRPSGDRIIGLFGTRAPGGVHETGASFTQVVTSKQRAFFWAKYYESGKDPKWKWAALSKYLRIEIEARPFLAPAIDKELNTIYKIYGNALGKALAV